MQRTFDMGRMSLSAKIATLKYCSQQSPNNYEITVQSLSMELKLLY